VLLLEFEEEVFHAEFLVLHFSHVGHEFLVVDDAQLEFHGVALLLLLLEFVPLVLDGLAQGVDLLAEFVEVLLLLLVPLALEVEFLAQVGHDFHEGEDLGVELLDFVFAVVNLLLKGLVFDLHLLEVHHVLAVLEFLHLLNLLLVALEHVHLAHLLDVLLLEFLLEFLLDFLPVLDARTGDGFDAAAELGVGEDLLLELVEFLADVVQVGLLALQLVLHLLRKFVLAVLGLLEFLAHDLGVAERAQLLLVVHFGVLLDVLAALEVQLHHLLQFLVLQQQHRVVL